MVARERLFQVSASLVGRIGLGVFREHFACRGARGEADGRVTRPGERPGAGKGDQCAPPLGGERALAFLSWPVRAENRFDYQTGLNPGRLTLAGIAGQRRFVTAQRASGSWPRFSRLLRQGRAGEGFFQQIELRTPVFSPLHRRVAKHGFGFQVLHRDATLIRQCSRRTCTDLCVTYDS